MKTISMPYEDYLKESEKSEAKGQAEGFRRGLVLAKLLITKPTDIAEIIFILQEELGGPGGDARLQHILTDLGLWEEAKKFWEDL